MTVKIEIVKCLHLVLEDQNWIRTGSEVGLEEIT